MAATITTERANASAALHAFQDALDGIIETYAASVPMILHGNLPDGISMDDAADVQGVHNLAIQLASNASGIAHHLGTTGGPCSAL
jgi:hypothetical protein